MSTEQAVDRNPLQTLIANDLSSSRHRLSDRKAWWSRTGSNRRPPACKAGALPAELRPLIPVERMVGLGGLEPPTSRLSSARSNQLSYKPLPKRRWSISFEAEPRKADRPSRLVPRPRGAPAFRRNAMRRVSANPKSRRKRNEGGEYPLMCSADR